MGGKSTTTFFPPLQWNTRGRLKLYAMWLVDNLNFDYMPNMADPIFQPAPTTTTQQGGIVVMSLLSMDDPEHAQPGEFIPITYYERKSPHMAGWRDEADDP